MKMGTKLLGIAVVLFGTLVGCQKKIDLTFYNHTDTTLPVKVTTPDDGTMNVGTIAGNGSMLNYTIRVNTSDMPANCSAVVGIGNKSFAVTEDTKEHLWFHYTKQGLAGPMDSNANVTVISQTGEVEVSHGTRMIVD